MKRELMKSAIALSLIFAGSAGFLACKASTSSPPKRTVTPITLTGPDSEKPARLAQLSQQARADMRTMAVAIESFYIDNNSYPDPARLSALTTPVTYISKLPRDPFTVDDLFGYRRIGKNDWLLWSIGPDLKEDGGNDTTDLIQRKQ